MSEYRSMPEVSVIIPTKDRGRELAEALESLRAQSFDDWEALVIDDASSEDIGAVVEQAADARIRRLLLPADRSGAPAGRNFGLQQAGGEFVLFLDSDDLLAPGCLEGRLAFLKPRPELDLAVWACGQFRDQPGDLPLLWNQLIKPDEPDLDRYLRRDTPWQTSSPLWRRASLLTLAGDGRVWDEEALSGQDWEFPVRVLLAGLAYEKIDEVDHYWRISTGQRGSIGKLSVMEKAYPRAWARTVAKVWGEFEVRGGLGGGRQLSGAGEPEVGDGGGLAGRIPRERCSRAWAGVEERVIRERFSVLWWEAARRLGERVSAREGRHFWSEARRRGIVGTRRYVQGWRYLASRRWPGLQRRIGQRLMLQWPAAYFFPQNPTFNKYRPPGAPPPRVSVIMSVHNAGRYVDEAVRSITRQSFRNLEFLICDDGSTDATREILRRHAAGDCRIRLLQQGKLGLVKALQLLHDMARGGLVARMDGDDVALPERLERQVRYLDAHPEVVLLGTQCQDIDPFGVDLPYYDLPLDHEAIDAQLLRGHGGIIRQPSCMYRRSAYDAAGGYRQQWEWIEDTDLFLRLAEVGRVANLPEVLLKYRIHPKSTNHARRHQQLAMKQEMITETRRRRGLPLAEGGLNEWKPDPPAEQFRQWGWRALKAGRKDAARGHSWSLLKLRPFSLEAWKLAYCAVRGR